MSNRRKAKYRDARQRGWRIEACLQRDRDRRASYLERDTPHRLPRTTRQEKKDRGKNKSNDGLGGVKGGRQSANNNNKQRYRRGLMLILIDRVIHDQDFNFGRDARTLLSHNRAAWIIQAEIIMCARAIIIQVKYNYTEAGRKQPKRIDGGESRAVKYQRVARAHRYEQRNSRRLRSPNYCC